MGYSWRSAQPTKPPEPSVYARFVSAKEAEEKRKLLQEALLDAERHGMSLLGGLRGAAAKWENPLEGVEIELKLQTDPAHLDELLRMPSGNLDALLDAGRRGDTRHGRFLTSTHTEKDSGQHTYFGTPAEERFVLLTEYRNTASIKFKGQSRRYGYGIPGEEHVLRRDKRMTHEMQGSGDPTERRSGWQETEILERILSVSGGDVRNRGTLEKSKATRFAINQETGRIYSIVASRCEAEGREPLYQVEIEYDGHLVGLCEEPFPGEHAIVEDILALAKRFPADAYRPTLQTKYDWLLGRDAAEAERDPYCCRACEMQRQVEQRLYTTADSQRSRGRG